MQKIIKIIILFIFLFVIGVFYVSLTRDTNYDTSSLINKDTPKFEIISFDGSNFYTRDDLKENNYTLINFWASWCAPCRTEHPILMELSQTKNISGGDIGNPAIESNTTNNTLLLAPWRFLRHFPFSTSHWLRSSSRGVDKYRSKGISINGLALLPMELPLS